MKNTSGALAFAVLLAMGTPAAAQGQVSEMDETTSSVSGTTGGTAEGVDDESLRTDVEVSTSKSGTTTRVQGANGQDVNITVLDGARADEQEMEDEAKSDEAIMADQSPEAMTPVAPVAAESRADQPRWWPSAIRIIPTAGASSFTTANQVDFDNFDNGFTAGAFLDFGDGMWAFETGVLALQTQSTATSDGGRAFDVDSWGIPLLAKFNFSGHPTSTVYLKAGAMPFQANGTNDDFDVLGVAGIGGAIPLFRNTALTLEASYNRLFDDSGDLGAYQGVALLGGLSFGM